MAIGGTLKGFFVFCGVVVTISLLGLSVSYLRDRDKAYEQRFVGALDFTDETIEATLHLHAGLYKPSIAPGSKAGYWVVSGIMVSKDNLGGNASAPFSAVLQSVCSKLAESACWHMVDLSIDGKTVAPAPLNGSGKRATAEGVTYGGASVEATAGQEVGIAPEFLLPEQGLASSAEPYDATPTLAGQPVDAPTSSLPATGAHSQASGPKAVSGGKASIEPAQSEFSPQDLTRFIQDALRRLNYKPGPSDGKFGPQTASAIKAYQRDFDLVPDGRPSLELLHHLRGSLGDLGQQSSDPSSSEDQPSG